MSATIHLSGSWAVLLDMPTGQNICGEPGPSTDSYPLSTCPNCRRSARVIQDAPRQPFRPVHDNSNVFSGSASRFRRFKRGVR